MANVAIVIALIIFFIILILLGLFFILYLLKPMRICLPGEELINGKCVPVLRNVLVGLNEETIVPVQPVSNSIPWQKSSNSLYNKNTNLITIPEEGTWNISFALLVRPLVEPANFYLNVSSISTPFVYTLPVNTHDQTVSGSISFPLPKGTQIFLSVLSGEPITLESSGSYMSVSYT